MQNKIPKLIKEVLSLVKLFKIMSFHLYFIDFIHCRENPQSRRRVHSLRLN